MKSNNFTLQPVGISPHTFWTRPDFFPIHFGLIIYLLFAVFSTFAGTGSNNSNKSRDHHYYLPGLNTAKSPLTGPESIRCNLYLLNGDNTIKLADGVLIEYNNGYHDSVNLEDAYKFINIKENLAIARYGYMLAIERRPVIAFADTVFLKLWKTSRRSYQFQFIAVNLDHPGMQAFLEDAYLGTRTLLAGNGTTKLNFSIDINAASANINRFRIVYQTTLAQVILPVTFIAVKGFRLNNKITIDWKVENEINIEKYEVERSNNGIDFKNVNIIGAVELNNASGSYSWTDNNPERGNSFYRIKSVDRDGSIKYSGIVKVTTGNTGNRSVSIFPNPVKGNRINLRFTNQPAGTYRVKLINNNGQMVYSGSLAVNGTEFSQPLLTNKKFAAGMYQLEIIAPDNIVYTQKAIVQE